MSDLAQRDYTEDFEILSDPYPWFEAIRTPEGVFHDQRRDIFYVTGFEEAVKALLDSDRLSSGIAVAGPKDIPAFSGSAADIRARLAQFRTEHPLADLMTNYDGQEHADIRSLLNRLFIPSRLKANKEYMAALADKMVQAAVADGRCEIVKGLSAAYVTLVIADLLGVPEEDQVKFREVLDNGPPAGNMATDDDRPANASLMYMGGFFMNYIAQRRARPVDDVMSELATATLPDGTLPEVMEVVKAAMFLFAAGQDTSAKLVANSIRFLCEDTAMQDRLRADPDQVPAFIEEMLRREGSVKVTTRLALEDVEIGGVSIPAGKPVVVCFAAANRDPKRWEDPARFVMGRAGIREHVAFGRGKHTCIGAALARAEVDMLLRALLRDTRSIRIDEAVHGKAGARSLDYEPSFIIRGLNELHVILERN